MPAAIPTWKAESPSPEAGSVSTSAMFPWIVISRPSRIQVRPKAKITSVCHRFHGSLYILAGTRVSTVFVASLTLYLLFTLSWILPKQLFVTLSAALGFLRLPCPLLFGGSSMLVRLPFVPSQVPVLSPPGTRSPHGP